MLFQLYFIIGKDGFYKVTSNILIDNFRTSFHLLLLLTLKPMAQPHHDHPDKHDYCHTLGTTRKPLMSKGVG